MLHWSQEASTGWTRNSWVWSRVKTQRAFHAAGRAGRGTRGGRRRRRREITKPCARVHHGARSGERGWTNRRRRPWATSLGRAHHRADAGRAASGQVDATRGRSYAGAGLRRRAGAGTGAYVTPSELAFLALGLILGSAVGGAITQSLARRPGPRRAVRVTIAPNAIPSRRAYT